MHDLISEHCQKKYLTVQLLEAYQVRVWYMFFGLKQSYKTNKIYDMSLLKFTGFLNTKEKIYPISLYATEKHWNQT